MCPEAALNAAIDKAGSQAALARICGVTPVSVCKWVKRKRCVPARFVLPVEAATGVSRHDLRPDIYPRGYPPAPEAEGSRFRGVDQGVGSRFTGVDRFAGKREQTVRKERIA